MEAFANPWLAEQEDQARLIWRSPPGRRLAFSTDSYVIDPLFFPGGDIGKLAVCGTANDVAVSGAIPRYLSCGFILEEGWRWPPWKRWSPAWPTPRARRDRHRHRRYQSGAARRGG
jgi:hydrogenase maturation factor